MELNTIQQKHVLCVYCVLTHTDNNINDNNNNNNREGI